LAIPFSTIIMAMATSFLTILDIDYAVAWPVVIALTVDSLVVLVSQFYGSCLMGTEAFDAEGKISLRQLVKSKIFKVFSMTYVQAAIALPLAYYVLTTFAVAGTVQAVLYVVLITIGVHISTFTGLYAFMRGSTSLPVAWKSIAKYVLASILMGIVLLLLPTTTTLVYTLVKAVAGLGIYIALLLAIDKQARELLNLIIEEIKGTIRQLTSKNNHFQGKNEAFASEN
jgi:hypothetical protein